MILDHRLTVDDLEPFVSGTIFGAQFAPLAVAHSWKIGDASIQTLHVCASSVSW